ncbi:heme-binding protein [Povalibacter sp.]|uniref:heme-binding protein n=1 Tax=Povalibacter sp. TaxID=1962978 RepID=UPI002F40519C
MQRWRSHWAIRSAAVMLSWLLAGCSGGDSVAPTQGTDTSGGSCSGSCASAAASLNIADVQRVLAQAIAEAQARDANATIAVVDRVGNVLAIYRMGTPASRTVTITSLSSPEVTGGLEGIRLPVAAAPVNLDPQAAIAKALTGAYLSSEGNAFSTRTASQIVQEHFNPGETFQPAGPLFGVQFSQLACSDFMQSFDGVGPGPGPHRSPLGLAADPGGFPLYRAGTVIGGVGVMADGVYGLDRNIADRDEDLDEAIAYAASFGFAAPVDRRGDRITVDGKTLRFSDVDFDRLSSTPASAASFGAIAPSVGTLISVNGYFDGVLRAGTAFGQPASGIRADGDINFPGQDAFVFVDAVNAPRYAPRAGTEGATALTQVEVTQILRSALDVANRSRAQIRRPLGSQARVTISVVDSAGTVLGVVRTRDAPVFGADVSLQKARTAAFLSSSTAAAFLQALPDAKYLAISDSAVAIAQSVPIGDYVTAARAFVANANFLGDGQIAFTDRAGGNLARPFYPDGIDNEGAGPFSKPVGEWSPFSTGLQLDTSINAILQHVLFVAGALPVDVAPGCAGVDLANDLSSAVQTVTDVRIANGLQIFPGSVPVYRNGVLVGGVGVSGDGIDQDDMIAFLGLHNASQALAGAIGNAPMDRRADNLTPQGVRLRYVQCPQAPFLNSSDDNVCEGK